MSLQQRFDQNLEAIKVLKSLKGAPATDEQRDILKSYSGFGGFSTYFTDEAQEDNVEALKALVTQEEYDSLFQGVLDAFYTPSAIAELLCEKLTEMGVNSSHKILDPAFGLGSLLRPWIGKAQLEAVEKDLITAAIAKAAYPEIKVHNKGLEQTEFYSESFDAIIQNPPFGEHKVFDSLHPDISNKPIHEYFSLRGIDLLKKGGVMALIVSSSMLDKAYSSTLARIERHCEVLGVWRLPESTFKEANTSVSTDLLLLRKLETPRILDEENETISALETVLIGYKATQINKYFHDTPSAVLGELSSKTGRFGGTSAIAKGSMDDALVKLADSFPVFDFEPQESLLELSDGLVPAFKLGIEEPSVYEQFQYFYCEKIECYAQRVTETRFSLHPQIKPKSAKERRLLAAVDLADKLQVVKNLEKQLGNDTQLMNARKELNSTYDLFTKAFGAINSSTNSFLLEDNTLLPIFGLEMNYQRKISEKQAEKQGVEPQDESWTKAAILTERIYFPLKFKEYAFTPRQALTLSLVQSGKVDLELMAEQSPFNEDQLIESLVGDLIFFDPESRTHLPRDEYVSGNIRHKLKEAYRHNALLGLSKNIEALEAVKPADILPHQLDVPFMAGWVPVEVAREFVKHITGVNYNTVEAAFGGFIADISGHSTAQNEEFGTSDVTCAAILEKLINKQQLVVRRKDADDRTYVDYAATFALQQKAEVIMREWKSWLVSDESRLEVLCDLYNEKINCYSIVKYDGRHLTIKEGVFKGQSATFQFRPHQVNAIWRQLVQRGGLLAHNVGSGKTSTASAVCYLGVEMGILTNPIVCVPSNVLSQWSAEMTRIFPNANVLMVDDSNKATNSATRRRLLARVASNKWHMIVMSHETFTSIQAPIEGLKHVMSDLMMEAYTPTGNDSSKTGRAIARKRESIINKAKKNLEKSTLHRGYGFEDLNSNFICCDESDLMKNCPFVTGYYNVKGLGNPEGAGKAFDFLTKVRYVNTQHDSGCRGVSLLTGTPISNSVAETYTLARYLHQDALEAQGLAAFDAFISTYSTPSSEFEINSTGGYKPQTRFRDFTNLVELNSFFRGFSDCVTHDYLVKFYEQEEGKVWPVPRMKGGKLIDDVLEPCHEFQKYNSLLIERTENFGSSANEYFKAEYPNDNMLAVMSSSGLASLDLRLVKDGDNANLDLEGYVSPKTQALVENIMSTFKEYDTLLNGRPTAQLVFVDLGTPKAEQEFSVYQDIKDQLIKAGLKDTEVEFIHNANNTKQRAAMFKKVREAKIRVLIGSTPKMGAGTNCQDRLVGLHSVTLDWKPRALTQQLGRILRQGNIYFMETLERFYAGEITKDQLFEVRCHRYALSGSMDAMMIQALETKANFINNFLSDNFNSRKITLRDEGSVDHSEFKARASGRPELLMQVRNEATLRRILAMREDHLRKNSFTTYKLQNLPSEIARYEVKIARLEKDAQLAEPLSEMLGKENLASRFTKEGRIVSTFKSLDGMLKHILTEFEKYQSYTGNDNFEQILSVGSKSIDARYIKKDASIELRFTVDGQTHDLVEMDTYQLAEQCRVFNRDMKDANENLARYKNYLNDAISDLEYYRSKEPAPFAYQHLAERCEEIRRYLTIAIDTHETVIDGVDVRSIELVDLEAEMGGQDVESFDDGVKATIIEAVEYEGLTMIDEGEIEADTTEDENSDGNAEDETKDQPTAICALLEHQKQEAAQQVQEKLKANNIKAQDDPITFDMFAVVEGKHGQLGLDF